MIDRKKFIQLGAAGLGTLLATSSRAAALAACAPPTQQGTVRFGVISDLHYDLMHDAEARAEQFITHMNKEKPNFILQLGDFCVPKPENQKLLDIWKKFNGPSYHTLGNHDTDGGFTKAQTLTFWGMQAPYYSFDREGFHFVVLDGNEKNQSKNIVGYPRTIEKAQLEWLRKDLEKTKLPTIISCHQGLDNTEGGLSNGMQVRFLFEQINKEAGFKKVILVLSGHHHLNYHNEINGIHYVQINSSSYYWVDESFRNDAFGEDFYKDHKWLRHTLIYEKPLWATIAIDSKKRIIQIDGTETKLLGKDLKETGIDLHKDIYPISTAIDSRRLKY